MLNIEIQLNELVYRWVLLWLRFVISKRSLHDIKTCMDSVSDWIIKWLAADIISTEWSYFVKAVC